MAWLAAKGALAAAGALATAIPAAAQSTTNAQLSAQIVQWGQANASAYAEAMAASRNPVGAVPVPPLIDPSCQLCGQQQNSVANGAQQAQAWINRALQPEDRYMVTLLNILKTAQQNQESEQAEQEVLNESGPSAGIGARQTGADPPPTSTLRMGLSPAEVESILGQPKDIVDAGPKKIYVYDNGIKVTFSNGKVSAVD